MIHMYYDDGQGGNGGQLIFSLIIIGLLIGVGIFLNKNNNKSIPDSPAKTITYDTIQINDSTFVVRPKKSN